MGNSVRLISFLLGGETFVLDIMLVRQIVPYAGSTPVPTAPAFIEGIIVHGGEVVPIVDLRRRLFPALQEPAPNPLVLVAATTAGTVGFKVDEVRRIVTVETDSFLPPPAIVGGVRGELLVGVVPVGEEISLLIDPERILTAGEQDALRNATMATPAEVPSAD
jgi:purine-binding chemotaxis protein CheW